VISKTPRIDLRTLSCWERDAGEAVLPNAYCTLRPCSFGSAVKSVAIAVYVTALLVIRNIIFAHRQFVIVVRNVVEPRCEVREAHGW
jgi:hypothetical protein